MKKDAFYFPHFSNARSDRRVRRVRRELGIEGYGVYFMLLEVLRDQSGFKYPVEDIDLLADEFGTSEQTVRALVFNYKLFAIDNDDFYSPKQLEYLQPYLKMKDVKRIGAMKGNLIKYGKITREQASSMTMDQIKDKYDDVFAMRSESESESDRLCSQSKQSKVKKSKVNKANIIRCEICNYYEDDYEGKSVCTKNGAYLEVEKDSAGCGSYQGGGGNEL